MSFSFLVVSTLNKVLGVGLGQAVNNRLAGRDVDNAPMAVIFRVWLGLPGGHGLGSEVRLIGIQAEE